MAARTLEDKKVVFAGAGIPLISSVLAQKTHAPTLTILFEGGVIAPEVEPGKIPPSTNEARAARRGIMLTSPTELFFYQQRGYVDYGFIGAAQIDMYGNVNTSVIGSYDKPRVRLPGSGGANDIISSCTRTIVATQHEARRFPERVDFITSPGYIRGGRSREESGLIFGKVYKVVTNLCVMVFDEDSRRMKLEALHPGVTLREVKENIGFELLVPAKIPTTEPPTKEILETLRSLDPEGRYIGGNR